jgi:hypothetical protein
VLLIAHGKVEWGDHEFERCGYHLCRKTRRTREYHRLPINVRHQKKKNEKIEKKERIL